MLADLHWLTIPIGPLTIQVWGLFVAGGMAAALLVARQFAKQRQLNPDIIVDAAFWIILASLIGSRVFFVVTEWSLFAGRWVDILKIWEGGMSISGGFIGAAVAGIIFFKLKQVPFWEYAEVIVYALPLGLFIGRLGCFFIFDHPGSVTNFFLGEVYYLDGLVRHNHGLYLSLEGLALFGLFTWLRFSARGGSAASRKTQARPPYFITIFLIADGLFRLWVDNDRILDNDVWLGLKAAQWMGIVSIIGGLVIFGQRQNIRKKFLSEKKTAK